jgi:type II secretory pathway pseudopilin PulG
MLAALAVVIAIAAVAAVALPRGGSDADSSRAAAAVAAGTSAADDALLRKHRPRAVEPIAGETAADAALPAASGSTQDPPSEPASKTSKADAPRSGYDNGPTGDAAISDADVLKNGIALPPIESPPEVRSIVESGNQIARTPYLWGGGHGKWLDHGYDCSGSVSFALASAGLLSQTLTSGQLMSWGEPGPGKWVTIYASPTHVFLYVAGIRFDTGAQRVTGSRWAPDGRSTAGFTPRHPAGL